MRTGLFLKTVAASMVAISLGLQSLALLIVLHEIFMTGDVGFGAAISYAASQPFSLTAFIIAVILVYFSSIQCRMTLIWAAYVGSHLLIWMCILAFPGTFAP